MASVFSRRVAAYLIDFIALSLVMWILAFIVYLMVPHNATHGVYQYFIYIVPVLGYVYFVLTEKIYGASIGKSLMYLEVRSLNGSMISWSQAIVRNITKIYWIPIIFDWLIGKILRTDRIFNTITRTIVIDEIR